MRYHAYRRFRLDRAPRNTRMLITCFYVMMLLATAVGIVNYRVRTGLTPGGTREWYLGNEEAGAEVAEMRFAKSVRELLDVTHPHLFEQSLIVFVLCHLYGLSSARERTKRWVYLLSFAAVLLDIGMPWLVRFVSPGFAALHVAATALLGGMFLVLIGRPLADMWWSFQGEDEDDAPVAG